MNDLGSFLEAIRNFLSTFGVKDGIFLLFFILAHIWIYKLYEGRLKDRQAEINRIADENREYRERFITLLDDKFGLKKLKYK